MQWVWLEKNENKSELSIKKKENKLIMEQLIREEFERKQSLIMRAV